MPDITVLLPFHKVDQYLLEAIASVTSQIDDIGELLLVSDRVPNEDIVRLSNLVEPNPKIRFIGSPGIGLIDALNFGLDQARHKYIARLDSDDVAIAGRFRRQEMYLEDHALVALIGTSLRYICRHGKEIGRRRMPRTVKPFSRGGSVYYSIAHPSVMFRHKDAIRVGLYTNTYPHCEDLDLWYRLEALGKLKNLKMFGLEYRMHVGQISAVHHKAQQNTSIQIALHRLVSPFRLNVKNIREISQLAIHDYRLGSVFAKEHLDALSLVSGSPGFEKLETIYAELDLLQLAKDFKKLRVSHLRKVAKYIWKQPRRSITMLRLHLRASPSSKLPSFTRCTSCREDLSVVKIA